MCGIFGAINLSEKFTSINYENFKEANDIVSYRGPDSKGNIAFNSIENVENVNEFNIFFGHRRLSIIDLNESGSQPMHSNSNFIVFNGEIFNYIELRNELKSKYEFKTESDTEVILKIYEEYGVDGFSKFNGMWAFLIYDSKKKLIIASRDRFSIKPLYILESNNCVYFSSEIKQLLPFLKNTRINQTILTNYLQQSLHNHSESTFFEGITKLKPRHNLIIDLETGKQTIAPYWNYELNLITDEYDAIEQFKYLFHDSVNIRLRSDVKVGALLSGGLDSSAISMVANEICNGNFETFSVVAKEKKYSEEKFVDSLVNQLNIPNKKLSFQQSEMLENIDSVVYHQDEPFASFSVIAQNLIFKKIKTETDITVILSGQGGDEILMGYLKYFFFNIKELTKRGKLLEVAKQIVSSLIYRTVLAQFSLGEAKRYIPFLAQKKSNYLVSKAEIVNTWSFENITQRQILDIEKFSVPHLAHYEDRNSMAWSIESRLPFLDHRLVNMLLSVSSSLKIKNGWTKYIMRKALVNLPNDIKWRRDKQGFITPEELWLKNDLQKTIRGTFEKSILDDYGIIDKNEYLIAYNSFINGNSNLHYNDLTRVYLAELWAKKFIK